MEKAGLDSQRTENNHCNYEIWAQFFRYLKTDYKIITYIAFVP